MGLQRSRLAASACIAFSVSACAEMNTVYRTSEFDDGKAIIVDAFQRSINVSRKTVVDTQTKRHTTYTNICAELPPPAFAAFGNAVSSGLQSGPRAVDLGLAAAQASGYVDLKTQLTKVHGEFLYRLCEAYNNGAIGQDEIEVQYRRFQNSTVALAAIEQLTGYARPTVVALGAGGNADTGDHLAQAQKELAAARDNEAKTAAAAAAAKDKADAAATAAAAKDGELTAAKAAGKPQAEQDKLKAELDNLKKASDEASKASTNATAAAKDAAEVRKTKEEIFAAARAVSATATTSPAVITMPGASASATEKVADAVKEIVEMTLHQEFASDLCLRYMFRGNLPDTDERIKYCLGHLKGVGAELQKKGKLYLQ